jgi:hypothetical protein
MNEDIILNKLDVAKKQLETAIYLYFHYGDPISIHTLTAAAYNIVRDICKKTGLPPVLIKGLLIDLVKQEKKKEFISILNKAENYFKHADKNHKDTLTFNPGQTELLIYDACSKYHELIGNYFPIFFLFQAWFLVNNPSLFFGLPPEIINKMDIIKRTRSIDDRPAYYETMFPIVNAMVEQGLLRFGGQ